MGVPGLYSDLELAVRGARNLGSKELAALDLFDFIYRRMLAL